MVIGVVFRATADHVHHEIDYLGAAVLTVGLSAVVLFTSLGGTSYGWSSPLVLALIATSVVMIVLFPVVETRATEPILPMALFRNRTFVVTSAVGFIIGLALFGSVTYLPLYLQVVKGHSPTESGLLLLPLMGGLLVTSILSGNLISRFGRYRFFPIVGTGLMAIGLFLLARLNVMTSTVTASLFMLVMGLGLGMVMQVLVLAVQNSVDYKYLGVATSGSTLFRQIGGSIGVAAFGAIFSHDLAVELAKRIPAGTHLPSAANPEVVKHLPPAIHAPYVDAFSAALHPVFLTAAGIAVVGFALTWLLRELPLRQTASAEGVGESFATPHHLSSEREIERILSSLMQREERERVYEQLIDRSGIEITPPEGWLLRRIAERPPTSQPALADELHVAPGQLTDPLASLTKRAYVRADADRHIEVTPAGQAASDQLLAAGREQLVEMLDGWEPEQDEELQPVLRRLAGALVVEMPGR